MDNQDAQQQPIFSIPGTQNPQKPSPSTKSSKILLYTSLMLFVITTVIRFWVVDYNHYYDNADAGDTDEQMLLKFVGNTYKEVQFVIGEDDLKRICEHEQLKQDNMNGDKVKEGQFNITKVNGKYQQQNVTKRIGMGAPKRRSPSIKIVTVEKTQKKDNSKNDNKYGCLMTNAVTLLAPNTIKTGQTILQNSQYINKWIIVMDSFDAVSQKLLSNWISTIGGDSHRSWMLRVLVYNVTVDSQYKFIRDHVGRCENIIYVQNYFNINQNKVGKLVNIINKQMKNNYVLFSSSVFTNNTQKISLPNLNEINLQTVPENLLTQYLLIFDCNYLNLVTPLNYAYYAKYTIQEIIIQPILAIVQHSKYLVKFQQTVHEIGISYVQFKQYAIKQVNKYQHKLSLTRPVFWNKSEDLCFVSYPLHPTNISYQLLTQYVQSIANSKNSQNSTIVINLPYIYKEQKLQENDILFKSYAYLLNFVQKGFNIRLRIRANKTVSSLASYEAAYTYCPNSSVMITSRHNIKFNTNFVDSVLSKLTYKYHYYFVEHLAHSKQIVQMNRTLHYQRKQFRSKGMYYHEYFMNLQIFKSDLFKMMYFWILKSDEIDFYETQASFVMPLIQMVSLRIGIINQEQFSITESRQESQRQKNQLQNLKLYFEWTQIPQNKLIPFTYNSLQNTALRKHAPLKIPRIIHQAWIGGKPISAFQSKLHQTLKQVNNDFEVILWRDQNITLQNFPFTYSLVTRSLQYQKYSNRSYSAPISSLIRYELLYRLGGIYIDFKTEGRKNLTPFLKYQIFFIDIDYEKTHYQYPANVGNGIMGAIKNNYYLRLLLTQLVSESKFNYKLFDFPKIVGGFVLRKSLTNYQLFCVAGYGFHFFSQKPATGRPNLCSYSTPAIFAQDQQVFQVQDYKTQKMFQIAIPCRIYNQSYLIMYKVLAGTWKPKSIQHIDYNHMRSRYKIRKSNKQ